MNDSDITTFFRGVPVLLRSAFDGARVQDRIPEIVARRDPLIAVSERDSRTRRVNTPWGSRTRKAGRICLNAELAKKPPTCLEFVVVEETPHLMVERTHNEQSRIILDRIVPDRQLRLDQLDRAYLAAEDWGQTPSSPSGGPR